MILPYRFEPEAETELHDAAVWYETESAGLGRAFLRRIREASFFVRSFPGAGSAVPALPRELGVRRHPVNGFPYWLVYMVVEDEAVILAVAHQRRRPGYWHERLG